MKNLILVLLIILLYPLSMESQRKDRVKGDKEVISTSGEIAGEFNKLEVSDNLLVEIQSSSRNSFVLTTDQNLSEEVEIEVREGVLKIYTKNKIVKNKKLHVFLNFRNLESISLNGDAEVKSGSRIDLDKIDIYMNNSSEIDLELNSKGSSNIVMNDNSSGKLKLKSNNIVISMNDRTDLKADLNTDDLKISLKKSADIKLDGVAKNAHYDLEDSSNLNAKKMKTQTAVLNSKNKSDIYIDVSKTVRINAEGKSKVYVYGNPNIEIEGFTDKSRIIKK